MKTTTQQFYSVREAAEMLGLNQKQVRSCIKVGDLPAERSGARYRISDAAIEAYRRLSESHTAKYWKDRGRRVKEGEAAIGIRYFAMTHRGGRFAVFHEDQTEPKTDPEGFSPLEAPIHPTSHGRLHDE